MGQTRTLIDPGEAAAALREYVAEAGAAVALTGAGISTESGIPDFRSPNSPWMRHKPIDFDASLASAEARREAWRRKFAMDDLTRDARPSRGHHALARLVAAGTMPAVITQNIDGLHQAAGVPAERVIELHGNGTYATCLDCGRRYELSWVRRRFEATGDAPVCEVCGGPVKSATISFGQAMPAGPCAAPTTWRRRATSSSRSARPSRSIRPPRCPSRRSGPGRGS